MQVVQAVSDADRTLTVALATLLKSPSPLAGYEVAVVSVTLKDAQPEQARFTPLAMTPVPVQDEHMEHQH